MQTESHIAQTSVQTSTAPVSQNNTLQTPYNTIKVAINAAKVGNPICIKGEPTMSLC